MVLQIHFTGVENAPAGLFQLPAISCIGTFPADLRSLTLGLLSIMLEKQ
jgi:hypothetical protein